MGGALFQSHRSNTCHHWHSQIWFRLEWTCYNCTLMRAELWQDKGKWVWVVCAKRSSFVVVRDFSTCPWPYLIELVLTFKQTHQSPLSIHSPTLLHHEVSSTWLLTSSPFGSQCWLGQLVNKNHRRGPGVPHTLRCLLSASPQPSASPAVNSWKRLIHNCSSSSSRVSEVCPHD